MSTRLVEQVQCIVGPRQPQRVADLRGNRAAGAYEDLLGADPAAQHRVGAEVLLRDDVDAKPSRSPSTTSSARHPGDHAGAARGTRAAPCEPAIAAPRASARAVRFIAGWPMNGAANMPAGFEYIAAGGATCTIRPADSSTTWSAMLIASIWSCVT